MKFPALFCAAALCACVGPNFHRPPAPEVKRYTAEPLAAASAAAPGPGGAAQRFLEEQEVPRNWWTLYGSQELDELVGEALRANPEVRSAQAALRQAMENTAAQRGSYFPAVQASFDAERQRDAVGVLAPTLASGSALYNLYTPQVSVSYVPDVFGANRRQVESLEAQAEAARFQLDATYLTLTANVVTTAIQEAGLRAQIAATQRVIALERESLGVLRSQLGLGAVAEVDVDAQAGGEQHARDGDEARADGPGVAPHGDRVGGLERQQRRRVDHGLHRHAHPGSLEEDVQEVNVHQSGRSHDGVGPRGFHQLEFD